MEWDFRNSGSVEVQEWILGSVFKGRYGGMMGVGAGPQGGNRSQGGGRWQNEALSMGGVTEVGSHGSPGSWPLATQGTKLGCLELKFQPLPCGEKSMPQAHFQDYVISWFHKSWTM